MEETAFLVNFSPRKQKRRKKGPQHKTSKVKQQIYCNKIYLDCFKVSFNIAAISTRRYGTNLLIHDLTTKIIPSTFQLMSLHKNFFNYKNWLKWQNSYLPNKTLLANPFYFDEWRTILRKFQFFREMVNSLIFAYWKTHRWIHKMQDLKLFTLPKLQIKMLNVDFELRNSCSSRHLHCALPTK